jgi:flagellar basal-body rod protein FlgC
MDALNTLYTAGSALTAQRLRMDVVSSNLANVETTSTPEGGPYRREMVVFEPLELPTGPGSDPVGVQVAGIVPDQSPFNRVYQPGNPQSDPSGFVNYPNVDLTTEMVDLLAASRAYQANATVVQATKSVVQNTLDLGSA